MNRADRVIYIISLAMIALGAIIRLVMFCYNRSLFLDEAYLVSSVVQRDYAGLFRPLDFSQGAPVGFLLLAKTCVYLFGSSEYSLRLIPLLAGIGSIALFYLVLKNVFQDQRPYIGTAFFATTPLLLYYSIEFKPYMLDGFLTLLSVYLFYLAIKQRIKTWALVVYCASVLWFSFPAIFTVAACCAVWLLYSILKQQKTIPASLVTGVVSLVSFGLLFATVYQYTRANFGSMTTGNEQYINLIRFPLIPHGVEDLKLIYRMGAGYLSAFDRHSAIVLLLLSGLALTLLWSKKRLWFVVFLSVEIVLLLVASWLGHYPILSRYVLFILPLHILLAAVFMADLWSKWRVAAIGLSLVFVVINIGSVRYLASQNVFRPRQEINPVLDELGALDKSIPLYVYAHAIPQYEYKTGYRAGLSNIPNAPIERNSAIYGTYFFNYKFDRPFSYESEIDLAKLEQNVRAIEAYNQVYLLFVLYDTLHRDALVTALRESGSVTEILNIYETPVYLYRKY